MGVIKVFLISPEASGEGLVVEVEAQLELKNINSILKV